MQNYCRDKKIPIQSINEYIIVNTPKGNWNVSFKEYANNLLRVKNLV